VDGKFERLEHFSSNSLGNKNSGMEKQKNREWMVTEGNVPKEKIGSRIKTL